LARIRVRLRRQPPRVNKGPTQYCFGDVKIDFEKFVAVRKGKPLDLTPREFDILRLLIQCRGEVVTRDRLLDEVWGYEVYPSTRTIDSHILNLRQKLEDDPVHPKYILTIYGEGYKFVG
jgi:DNA-binding response OmpR family regulator